MSKEKEKKTTTEEEKPRVIKHRKSYVRDMEGRRKEAKKATELRKLLRKDTPVQKKIKKIRDEVIKEIVELKEKRRAVNASTIIRNAMRRHGYAESSIEQLKIVETKSWNEGLEVYLPDNLLLARLLDLVLSKNEKTALGAIQESNKLKNKYPALKVKLEAYREDMDKYTEVVIDVEDAEVVEVSEKNKKE